MKKRITALALAIFMVMGTVAVAAGTEKTITVTPMSMNINGQMITPTKSDGTPAEVFSYDGATYAPVRYLSELLGIQVGWDAKDAGTIKLTGDNLKVSAPAQNTFTGEGKGRNGAIQVEVTMKDGKVESVTVKNHSETAGIADPALDQIPKAIVEAQSLGVDAVAGATLTTQGILEAVESCLEQAGVNVEDWKKPVTTTPVEKTTERLECEIVVVGGGGTGLSAAASALDHGAKDVIVLEKLAALGGSTARAGGALAAAGTKYQKAASIVDTQKAWVEYWIDDQKTSYVESKYPDRKRLESLTGDAVEVVEWIGDTIGLNYATPRPFGWGGPCRAHVAAASPCPASGRGSAGGGIYIVEAFEKYLDGRANIMTETAGTELITDKDGNVIGVHAEGKAKDYDIYAQSVVLATGGFAKNAEMLKEYIPNTSYHLYTDMSNAGTGSDGDGIRMALEAGGQMYEDPWIIGLSVAAKNPAVTGALTTVDKLKDSCFVDQNGRRFVKEDVSYPTSSIAAVDAAWSIIDSADAARAAKLAAGVDNVEVVVGNTWEELAAAMGADPAVLKATMDRYNEAAKTGKDTEFNKESPYIIAREAAPFYAVRLYPVTGGTLGGVKTNANFQVLNGKGNVIKGLYAGGECANKVFYNQVYTSGSGLTIAVVSGYTIGRVAAANLK